MKAFIAKLALISSFMLFVAMDGNAFSSPVGGMAGPPPWAPANGYRENVRHIYFPHYNMYYDLKEGQYLIRAGNRWEKTSVIPKGLTQRELREARKVEVPQHLCPLPVPCFSFPQGENPEK